MNKYILAFVATVSLSFLSPVVAHAVPITVGIGVIFGANDNQDNDYRNRQRYHRQYNRADYDGYYNKRRTNSYNNKPCYAVDQDGNKYTISCNTIRRNNTVTNTNDSHYDNNYNTNGQSNGTRTTVFCQDTARTRCQTVIIN